MAEDVPPGDLLGVVTTRGERICIANCDGELLAVSNVCTHQDFEMSLGTIRPGCVIECAWHGAQFDVRTGDVIREPATEPLPVYHVRIANGEILVGPRRQA